MAYDKQINSDFKFEPPVIRDHTEYGCARCCQPDEDGFVEPGCSNCHDFDLELALAKECKLCVTLYENKVAEGLICPKHPQSYGEPDYCEGCASQFQH